MPGQGPVAPVGGVAQLNVAWAGFLVTPLLS